MNETYNEYAEGAINLTADIIKKHGPRVTGTKSCENAGADLEKILGKYCTHIKRETFGLHPESFFAFGKIFTIVYLIGLTAILINNKISTGIGLIFMITGTVYIVTHSILFLDLFDALFGKVTGNNIIGSIEPKNAVEQQVIIVSHYDSSRVFPFHEKVTLLFPFRLFVPFLLFLFCLFFLFIAFSFRDPAGNILLLPIWIKYILLFGVIPVLPMYGYISKRLSPGAGDNLIGCTIGIKLAEIFQKDENTLQNTRIVFLLTDGEEAGMKGAKFFIRNNTELLKETRTIIINVDSVYEIKDIAIVKRDRNGFTKLSDHLAKDIKLVATALGYSFKTISIPFGGGGTDACQFALEKIKTICIIGMPVKFFRKEILIHTMKDTVDKISKMAVSIVIEVITEYLKKTDTDKSIN